MATVLDMKRERVAVLRALLRELAGEKTSVEARMGAYEEELRRLNAHVAQLESEPEPGYMLTDLEALEPDALPLDAGVEVTVRPDPDGAGFYLVDLRAPTPDAIVAYVSEHWDEPDTRRLRDLIEAA